MKKNRSFTLIELLSVIAIILIIISIGIPAYNSWRDRAKIAKAKAAINKIEMALEMYKTDNGVYPDYSGNLNNGQLISYLGEYLELRKEDLSGNVLVDPWGKAYKVYADHDGSAQTGPTDFKYNRSSYYIYSDGSGKVIDNYKG